MMQILIEVPDELGEELQNHQNDLVEILRRGLQQIQLESSTQQLDVESFVEKLIKKNSPEQILALTSPADMETRFKELLERKNIRGTLPASDEQELNLYFLLEHVIRLAKIRTLKKQKTNHNSKHE